MTPLDHLQAIALALERPDMVAELFGLSAQRGLARARALQECRHARVVLDEVVVDGAELVELAARRPEVVLDGEQLALRVGEPRARGLELGGAGGAGGLELRDHGPGAHQRRVALGDALLDLLLLGLDQEQPGTVVRERATHGRELRGGDGPRLLGRLDHVLGAPNRLLAIGVRAHRHGPELFLQSLLAPRPGLGFDAEPLDLVGERLGTVLVARVLEAEVCDLILPAGLALGLLAERRALGPALLDADPRELDLEDAQPLLALGEAGTERGRVALERLACVLSVFRGGGEPRHLAAGERELAALRERRLLRGGERRTGRLCVARGGGPLRLGGDHELVGATRDGLALGGAALHGRGQLGVERALAVARLLQVGDAAVVAGLQLGRPLEADRERLLGVGDARGPRVAVECVRGVVEGERGDRRGAEHGADERRDGRSGRDARRGVAHQPGDLRAHVPDGRERALREGVGGGRRGPRRVASTAPSRLALVRHVLHHPTRPGTSVTPRPTFARVVSAGPSEKLKRATAMSER